MSERAAEKIAARDSKPRSWYLDLSLIGSYFGGSDADYYTIAALVEGMRLFNERMLERCAALELTCIDLAAKLPQAGTLYYDDMHFTEAGAVEVARIVAEGLAP